MTILRTMNHEIQSTYFEHENFILYTVAFYFHRDANIASFSSNINYNSCLIIVSVAAMSYETFHDHNVAFTNKKLIFFVHEINPAFDTFHFCSAGCARQFWSKYAFNSFCYYLVNIKLTWNFREAHLVNGMLSCDEIVYYNEEVPNS